MTQRQVYPLSTWVIWTLGLPGALLALGVALAAATDIGDLPFDNPGLWWLGGAGPVAGLMFLYGLARRRRALRRFTSDRLAALLASSVSPHRQALRASLVVLAIIMLTWAILGPRWGVYIEEQKVYGVDIVVALDVSRSMLAEDLEPNRLEHAKRAIRQQLTERAVFQRAHRLALMAFSGTTSLRVPLTTDHLSFRDRLESLKVGSVPRGGTAIAHALRDASDLFARSPEQATKIILLFTDGEDHEGDPVQEAQVLYERSDIRVFTIGVGNPARTVGAEVPSDDTAGAKPLLHDGQIVFSKLDSAGLREISGAGGGRYAPIGDLHVLVEAISEMSRTELAGEQRERHRPRYQWFLALALALVGIETLLSETRPGFHETRRVWQQEADV